MKRIRLLGLALIALIALGAFASTSAFAETEQPLLLLKGVVPTEGKSAKFTSEAPTEAVLETTLKLRVKCKKAKNTGEFTDQDKGTVLIRFEGCTSEGLACLSEKENEVILTKGPIQLVDVLPTGTLDLGIYILPTDHPTGKTFLSFVCGGLLTVKVLGNGLIGVIDNEAGGLLTPSEGLVAKTEVKALWKASSAGEQEIKTCMSLKTLCEKGPFELKSEIKKGTEELAAEIADAKINFTEAVTIVF